MGSQHWGLNDISFTAKLLGFKSRTLQVLVHRQITLTLYDSASLSKRISMFKALRRVPGIQQCSPLLYCPK